jgi:heme-degrading monooxygenase HmoA
MYARVARYEVPPERLEAAAESFREAGAGLAQLDGFEGGYLLVDDEDGSLLTMTLWRSRTALESSETRASLLRGRAAQAVEGAVQSVRCYEVASELGETRDAG